MNELQEKSILLIEEYFNNIDKQEFLKEHEMLENNIGPIIIFEEDNNEDNK